MQPLETQARELADQINKIERPRLGELDTEISAIARAMGGRRMSEGPAAQAARQAPDQTT
jgi:hypothetical protein